MRHLFILFFVCAQTLLLGKTHPTNLKAFIVRESYQPILVRFYQQDATRMKKWLEVIAAQTNLTPTIQSVTTLSFTKEKLSSWIQKLSPNDVAVFYYVGMPHYQLQDQWPSLEFAHKHQFPSLGSQRTLGMLSQEELTKMMKEKGPHLSVILFDCYNNVLKSRRIPPLKKISSKVVSKTGMRRLFVKSSGVFSACSKQRDEIGYAAYQKAKGGGIFTFGIQTFFQSSNSISTWSDLNVRGEALALHISKEKQHPLMCDRVVNPPAKHLHHLEK